MDEQNLQIEYPERLVVASSPHIRHKDTTAYLMLQVIIALAPALIFGIVLAFTVGWRYGLNSLLLTVVCMAGCVFFEWLYEKITRRPVTVRDLSALLTGMLLAMNLPITLHPLYALLGSAFAIIVAKQLFGGLGRNFVNPALAARVFLVISFVSQMSGDAYPMLDGTAGATPLVLMKAGEMAELSLMRMFLGLCPGTLGEVSSLLLILGGLYLIAARVISWRIPAAYIGTVALITFIFPSVGGYFDLQFMAASLFSGGLMLGAFFMATDYVTSPTSPRARLAYGVLCGLLTVFIRYFCGAPEGVSYAILISNLSVYYLDRFLRPRQFGQKRGKKA